MSLSLYNKKRRFNETPEPEGKQKSSRTSLRFVIQKHDASHVHYDFRLEMEGVLKSWAVPKGPSLNPEDKRLAMMVEDHPYDYRTFEGVIPEGNYGGGTVIVWDEGFYEPLNAEGLSRKQQEKLLLEQLHDGSLKFIMHGKKIKGEYALFEMKGRGERSWILMKKKDEYASKKDITKEETSVKTGKTLVQVAEENGTTVNHPDAHGGTRNKKTSKPLPIQLLPEKSSRRSSKTTASKKSSKTTTRSAAPKKSASPQKKAAGKKKAPELTDIAGEYSQLINKEPMPHGITPMLATLVNEPFDSDDWIFEIKWDGYRAVAYVDNENVELQSRKLTSFTDTYYPVTDALKELGIKAVFDGEITAVNEKGMADFQALQNWQNTPVELQYFIFDILWLNGYDLTDLPLIERKKILQTVLPQEHPVIKYSDHVIGKGKDFFNAALNQGLEGMMAKKASSVYRAGKRTDDWVKVKVNLRQEVVIGGFTRPRNSRKYFGALMLGVYENGKLRYVGHTGSGFNTQSLEQVYQKLQPLATDKCPFEDNPKGNMPVTWVKPSVVCEIKFTEWTKEGIARHPIFMGIRTDKKAKEVKFEKPVHMTTTDKAEKKIKLAAAPKKSKATKGKAKKAAAASRKGTKYPNLTTISATEDDQEIVLNKQTLKLTNLDKLYWKKEKFTKGDMINYYLQIAPYMMPYMVDRPQSLNRHPNGIEGPSFYQKDMKGKIPDWMQTHEDYSESNNKTVEYLVCSNEATLIYMANLGCIEMHPWHSRVQSWQYPDWCLIDLDPGDKTSFEEVIDVAHVVKKVLDAIGATSCVKTSGSSGIHIYIPFGAQYDFDQSKQLAELIVTLVNQELPDITSMERSPAKRKGKLYLDYLQNRQTQTAAAPYSLRPKPGVPVSTPLDWTELKKGLKPDTYNARNIFERLKTEGDLFKPVLGKGINLQKVLTKLAAQFK